MRLKNNVVYFFTLQNDGDIFKNHLIKITDPNLFFNIPNLLKISMAVVSMLSMIALKMFSYR
jgi:hypothetical protein